MTTRDDRLGKLIITIKMYLYVIHKQLIVEKIESKKDSEITIMEIDTQKVR